MLGEPGPSGNSLATSDFITIVQDNGVYHFSEVGAVTGLSGIVLCTVVTGACAIGQPLYFLGAHADTGHIVYRLAATSSINKETVDAGIFYGMGKGYPMQVYNLSDCTGSQEFRWITVGYINK